MHWRLPKAGSSIAPRALTPVSARMDAVIVHSSHGAESPRHDFGVPEERLEVIPHGAFDYLTRLPEELPLPDQLQGAEGPVILAFGLIRPYKGTEVLLEAFERLEGAELWIVGKPMMPLDELRDLAQRVAGDGAIRRSVHRGRADPGDSCAAPTSSSFPISTSSNRGCCTRRSPSAGRSSSVTSAASVRSPRRERRDWSRPGTRRLSRQRLAS